MNKMELSNNQKKNLDSLVKKSEDIFNKNNSNNLSRMIYKIKTSEFLKDLKNQGYNVDNYAVKFANIYFLDENNMRNNISNNKK